MTRRLLHISLVIAAGLSLSGCASNCNILSSNNSGACNAMLMGGMILAAPIAAPAALLSDAAYDAKARRMAQEWQSSMEASLANNDFDAIQECLLECDTRWKYELDYRVRDRLQHDAARRFLAGDWAQTNREDYRILHLLAHYTLSWQPENDQDNAQFVLVPEQVRQSYALLKDPAVQAQLKKQLSYSRYYTIESVIYGMRFAIQTPDDDTAARAYFHSCPDAMENIMFDEASALRWTTACSRAYSYHFRERVPEDLRKKWDDDRRAKVR